MNLIDRVNELLMYEPESGILTWKVSKGTAKKGNKAGTNNQGYLMVSIDSKIYSAHRICWLIYYGEMPENQIDHINGNRSDNRIVNMRSVTNQQNQMNRKNSSINTSGCAGVHWHSFNKKWQARINVKGNRISLGSFDSLDDAVRVRKDAEIKYGFHENHGRRNGNV